MKTMPFAFIYELQSITVGPDAIDFWPAHGFLSVRSVLDSVQGTFDAT